MEEVLKIPTTTCPNTMYINNRRVTEEFFFRGYLIPRTRNTT
jgi:hypothetical protein